jgi:chromosome segregation ATPase
MSNTNENEIAHTLQELDRLREERKQLNAKIGRLVDKIKRWDSGLRKARSLEKRLTIEKRTRAICDMRAGGTTYKQIAAHFGISICRARQIFEIQRWREQRRGATVTAEG